MKRIQFGLNIATSAEPGADPVAAAVTAEKLGFDFVSYSDHPSGSSPTYETWTMLLEGLPKRLAKRLRAN